MSRRRRQSRNPRCRECRAEVLFFRDLEQRMRIVNARPVNGRDQIDTRYAMPEWGGRLWSPVEDLAAELSTIRPVGTDVLDEVFDLPWYQLHNCQITGAIAEAVREDSNA